MSTGLLPPPSEAPPGSDTIRSTEELFYVCKGGVTISRKSCHAFLLTGSILKFSAGMEFGRYGNVFVPLRFPEEEGPAQTSNPDGEEDFFGDPDETEDGIFSTKQYRSTWNQHFWGPYGPEVITSSRNIWHARPITGKEQGWKWRALYQERMPNQEDVANESTAEFHRRLGDHMRANAPYEKELVGDGLIAFARDNHHVLLGLLGEELIFQDAEGRYSLLPRRQFSCQSLLD